MARIGIVATEFPPAVGGMEQHAAGLADAFAIDNSVTVFTQEKYADVEFSSGYVVRPILAGSIKVDIRQLRREQCELWLTLNAGYSCLSRYLDGPVFAYTHGNDFIRPWTDTLTSPEHVVVDVVGRLPYAWRFERHINYELARRRIAAGLAGCKIVFVNSRHIQELVAKTFPYLDTPVTVSWPGIAEEFFEVSSGEGARRDGTLRLLSVARLSPMKNLGNVLRALALLNGEIDFAYTVIGDGTLRRELEDLAENLGIRQRTRFLGSLSSRDVITHLDTADLLVQPSLIETFGIAFAEAAARGVPSLTNRTAGATDAVLEDVNAIVANGPEPDQIADAVRRFCRIEARLDRDKIRQFALQFRRSTIMARLKDTVLGAI